MERDLEEVKLHIVLDKSSDITNISSPLHKRMKPSDSPVHDCIKKNHETLAKEDVDFQEMDYSDDDDIENEIFHFFSLNSKCLIFKTSRL
jgi:hypothetical protein